MVRVIKGFCINEPQPPVLQISKAHLSCGELPVRGHSVGSIHKKLRHTEAVSNRLQFQSQQVAVDALPIQSLQQIRQERIQYLPVSKPHTVPLP